MISPPILPLVTHYFFSASDGLRLHICEYTSPRTKKLPIVCLPGLTRHSADFASLAAYLAGNGYRVLAFDYRGRGLSQWDVDPRRYNIWVENEDIQTGLASLDISEAIFIGTSRGGLHILALAALCPSLLRGVVLNDIGPKIESAGLQRIGAYVGKSPQVQTLAEAKAVLQRGFGAIFPQAHDEDWDAFARGTFQETPLGLTLAYDPLLLMGLQKHLNAPLPDLWPQFRALRHIPVLSIRGALSDLFSAHTQEAMARCHPHCQIHVVEDQGHAPLLRDLASMECINTFLKTIG